MAAGRAVDLMDDDSLRDGDAVMTADGLRVFIGEKGPHHEQDDFVKVSETDGLTRRKRAALLAVDKGYPGAPAVVTGRSVSERKSAEAPVGASGDVAKETAAAAEDAGNSAAPSELSAGVPIIDPRGRRLRYVGP